MDNQRIILWALFAGLAFLTWSKWQADRQAPPSDDVPLPAQTEQSPLPVEVPAVAEDDTGELPTLAPVRETQTEQDDQDEAATIKVETDLLKLEISTTGGTLVRAVLKKYPKSKDAPDVPVQLLRNEFGNQYLLGSGLVDGSQSGPTHIATLKSGKRAYSLGEADVLEVPLTWSDGSGVSIEKIYRFRRGRYNIDLDYRITNGSQADWRGLSYLQIRKTHNPPERSMFNVDSYSFNGPVAYDGEKYEKIDPEDLVEEPLTLQVPNGWIAAIEHHFLSAAVPPAGEIYNYDSRFENGVYTLRASGPATTVPAGSEVTLSSQLFIGPKLQEQLEGTAEGLELTVDYGVLAILAQPLFWLLEIVHGFVGNWGWSIILVTFLIKLAFYKLTEASGRSMAKMRKLQPRLKALQERYKDDRQALSQHMMDLYKREKVNPAAGCLPMLIQIPFFIAFYWVLLESVEMRQAPFALWISDLSSRDPYFILPLLMGVAMFVQQKLNPAPPDPVQAKVMTILPIMFTAFFAFFPSGLVLYWLTNSVLSVAQQWNINRKMHAD